MSSHTMKKERKHDIFTSSTVGRKHDSSYIFLNTMKRQGNKNILDDLCLKARKQDVFKVLYEFLKKVRK